MPKGGGTIYPGGDIAIIDKIVDLEAQIDREIDQLTDIRDKIGQAIFALADVKERTLMDYRYLQGMTFEWIASTMGYHWRSVHKIHVRALNKIQIGQ
jgi:DNA-directed RNA polymerase specialized sigma subunit